jgi:uncharacterized repeat protein (TIGR03803 family)
MPKHRDVHNGIVTHTFLSFVMATLILFAVGAAGQVNRYKVLYSFTGGTDGGILFGGLVIDPAGNLYGTTTTGGVSGAGTIFKVTTAGTETTLYSFAGLGDGTNSYSPMILDSSGNLYGTTLTGGLPLGGGTVFELDTTGRETILHDFDPNRGDGRCPESLVFDSQGNLYGVTSYGGTNDRGLIYELVNSGGTWTEKVLYRFAGGFDGSEPSGALVFDSAGNLYGTTEIGGTFGKGTIYELTPSGQKIILHNMNMHEGFRPNGSLIFDAEGNLYGTASGGALGYGSVFKLDPAGNLTVLYEFKGGFDGSSPYGPVVMDSNGYLYGTANAAGYSFLCNSPYGCGVAFRVDSNGNERVMHAFKGSPDGRNSWAGLVRDPAGHLFGVTLEGGNYDFGTVYAVTPLP